MAGFVKVALFATLNMVALIKTGWIISVTNSSQTPLKTQVYLSLTLIPTEAFGGLGFASSLFLGAASQSKWFFSIAERKKEW